MPLQTARPRPVPTSFAETTDGMAQRLDRLEENEQLQAELVKKITEQQQGLAEGLEFMASRLTGLLWIAGIADVVRRTSGRRLRSIEEKVNALLKSGMIAYLREDLGGAEADLAQVTSTLTEAVTWL